MRSNSCLTPRPYRFQAAIGDELGSPVSRHLFIIHHPATLWPGRKDSTTRGRVSVALLAFVLSACSINCVRAIVLTLADCPPPLSWSIELLAMASGLSLRRSPATSELRPNTICIGETPATGSRLFFPSCKAPKALFPLVHCQWLDVGHTLKHEFEHLGVVFDTAPGTQEVLLSLGRLCRGGWTSVGDDWRATLGLGSITGMALKLFGCIHSLL